jgi:hypothetical protein
MTGTTGPRAGDTLVVTKSDDRALVFKLDQAGQWIPLRNGEDVSSQHGAYEIARSSLAPTGTTVWFRLGSDPETAIQRYRPD